MSRPLRYASGDQSSTAQGQHGPTGAQAEEDPPGPGSSISSSVTSAHSGGTPPPMSCRPERSRVASRSIDVQIGRARAGAGLLRKATLQPRGRRVTGIQRECLSSATGMVSYPVPSAYASKGHRHPGVEIASDPSRPRADEPSKLSSALSSNPPSRGDSVLMVSIDRKHVTLSLPVLSTSASPLSDTPATPTPPSRLSVSESASNILRRFGLEKEDLDHLVSYPEDRITPASLPFILRQIGIEKTERALGASQCKARPEPQPVPSQSVVGGDGVSHSGGATRFQEESSSAVLEPSKVTDGGRGDECVEGAAGEVWSVSRETCGGNGSTSPADAAGNKTEVESVALGLSRDQAGPASSLGPLDASKLSCAASPISDRTQMQTQANRQTLPGSSSMPSTAVESEAADPVDPLIDQESSPGHRSASPKPDPVLVGSSDHDCQSTAQVSQTISLPASSAAESVARLASVPACPPPAACPPAQPVPGPSDVTQPTPPSSDQQPAAEKVSVSKGVPSAATMSDGAAATPGRFPHTCRPCRSKCLQMKDWISHQNTDLHLERRKHLRLRYPEWDGEIPSSRSRSPHSSRSQSGSRPTSSRYRSCLTSPERRRDDKGSLPRRRDERRSASRSRDERRSTSRSRDERRSTSKGKDDKRSTLRSRDDKRSTSRSRDDRRSTLRSRDNKRSTLRRRDERRLPGRRTNERRGSSSDESSSAPCKKLAEKLLKNSAVDLLSKPSDLDALLQTLAPIVLAELAKRKSPSPSSSSSSSYSPGETSSSPAASSSPPPAKKRLTQKPSEASSSPKAECGKPSPPTMVKLTGIHASLSRSDVLAAVQHFGKTKSFLLFPSKLEAIVCFENKEDATKLKSLKSLDVKGIRITVFEGKKAVCHRKQKPLITAAAAASSVFTPEGAVTRKVLLPTPDWPPLEWPEKPPPAPPGARKGPFEGRWSAGEGSRVSCAHGPEAPQACRTRSPLTVGEIIEKHLSRERMKHFKKENVSLESEIECFEEDAKKSNSPMSSDLKGIKVTVAGGTKIGLVQRPSQHSHEKGPSEESVLE